MSSITSVDTTQMEMNSATTNCLARSKKLPPPPLCLPAPNTNTDEEKIVNSNPQREQRRLSHNSCLSSSSEDCSHKPIPFILPTIQRPQILETLITSSSILLVPPPYESKQKKSHAATHTNQLSLFRDRQKLSKMTVTDSEWIDFMRLIVHKPLANEIKLLLDKYKTTYFDRVNAPNTTDETIRSSLREIAVEALNTYPSSSVLPIPVTKDDSMKHDISPLTATTTVNNSNSKRKRKQTNTKAPSSASATLNNQSKFVVSYITSGRYEHNNDSKLINQQQQKPYPNKYQHLFRYVPDHDEQTYLMRKGHLKSISTSSSSSLTNNNLCLMLHDEVLNAMDEYDLDLSGISIDDAFTLPESMLVNMSSSIQ